jgi:hypothetical protein
MDDTERVTRKAIPDVDKLTKDTLRNGGVLALLYFDIHTKSKEKAQEIGTGFVSHLLTEQGVVYAVGEIEEPMVDNDLYSSAMQVKVLCKSFLYLANLCSTHSPFSVEILKPDEIRLQLSEAHELLGNVASTTADYKKYIVEQLSKPEDLERYKRILEHKAALGKKILDKKEDEKK